LADLKEPAAAAARKGSYHHGDLREALLAAAELELRDKGVEGFTLRGCAKRAGVSHAAPAHHFPDANSLLTELAAVGFRRFLTCQQKRKAATSGDPQSQLLAAGLGYVDFARDNPALFKLMFTSERTCVTNSHFKSATRDAFLQLVSDVGAVIESDPESTPEGKMAVSASWSMVHGIASLMISGRLPYSAMLSTEAADAVLAEIMSRAFPVGPLQPAERGRLEQ
jgi:AcrR family transcriptional regulator